MRNRYLLILNNNYNGMKFLFELLNTTDNPNFYKFDISSEMIPEEMVYGEYDFFLIRCELPYEIEFCANLIDSKLTVTDFGGEVSTWALRDLPCESGILSFEPDSKSSPYEKLEPDTDSVIIDMI